MTKFNVFKCFTSFAKIIVADTEVDKVDENRLEKVNRDIERRDKHFWTNKNLSKDMKLKLYENNVTSTFIYCTKYWVIYLLPLPHFQSFLNIAFALFSKSTREISPQA